MRDGTAGRQRVVVGEATDAGQPARHRHDGWTAARQAGFLERLAETACVSEACGAVGPSTTSASRAFARLPDFVAAWHRALAARRPMLEDAAVERATRGVAVPITRSGKVMGQRQRFSDGLLRYLLERGERRAAAEARRAAEARVIEAPRVPPGTPSPTSVMAALATRLDEAERRQRERAPQNPEEDAQVRAFVEELKEHGYQPPKGWDSELTGVPDGIAHADANRDPVTRSE